MELPAVLEAEDIQSDDYALVVGDLSDTEQLSLEIEDIDETYGLINLSEIETSVPRVCYQRRQRNDGRLF